MRALLKLVHETCSGATYFDIGSSTCAACFGLCTACTGATNGLCSGCVTLASLSTGSCTCDANYYQSGTSCLQCDQLCATCSGAGSTACDTCASGKYLVEGASTCVSACSDYASNYYLDGTTCKQCDPLCDTCTGAGNSLCSLCATNIYAVESTSTTCVATCTDHAANFFLDGSVCKQCDVACASCTASQPFNCNACSTNYKEVVGSSVANPKECVSTCGAGTYTDGNFCRGKSLFP